MLLPAMLPPSPTEPSLTDILRARDQAGVSVRVARGGAAGGRGGIELVAQCVDPTTGHVDTYRIALWVSEAARSNVDVAARAYAAIEAQLLKRGAADLARFNQDLVDALRSPGTRLPRADNPVLQTRWQAIPPADRVGEAAGLHALLARHALRPGAPDRA